MDPRTREYLSNLAKTLNNAEEICQCAHCTKEREKKQMTQEVMNEKLAHFPDMLVQSQNPYGSNYYPELSPDYEFMLSGKKYKYSR